MATIESSGPCVFPPGDLDDVARQIGFVTVDDMLVLLPPPGRRFGIFGGS